MHLDAVSRPTSMSVAGEISMKHQFTRAVVLSCLLVLAACGTPVQHFTPSGKVEEVFGAAPEIIKGPLVGLMANNGFNMTKDTPYMLAFDKPSDNLMANVLLGSKYDAIPNVRISYSFVPLGPTTRVIADVSIITNPGSAFERITPANNNESTAKLQLWLDDLSRQITSAPGLKPGT